MTNNIIGIDVGASGGIAVLSRDGDVLFQASMPYINKVGVDLPALTEYLRPYMGARMVYFEVTSPPMGCSRKSAFAFGRSSMAVEAVVSVLGFPYTKVPAVTWQKELFTGIPLITKPKKKNQKKAKRDTKAMAMEAARRRYPGNDFKGRSSQRGAQDGIVDALLIAEYGRRVIVASYL